MDRLRRRTYLAGRRGGKVAENKREGFLSVGRQGLGSGVKEGDGGGDGLVGTAEVAGLKGIVDGLEGDLKAVGDGRR